MDFAFKILVLTMHKEPDVMCQAFLAGADGYMLKDGMTEELLSALYTIVQDKIYLSPLIAGELPDRCRARAIAEQGLPSYSLKHCGQDLIRSHSQI
jgi:DNA-binding NarL/FixJ family response regulator